MYCCSACRQKAHRVRTAERVAELSQRVNQNVGLAWSKRDRAASSQHVQNVVDRARQLCRTAAERMQQAASIHERCRADRLAGSRAAVGDSAAAPMTHPGERALWRGP